jgi:hypothetical protein
MLDDDGGLLLVDQTDGLGDEALRVGLELREYRDVDALRISATVRRVSLVPSLNLPIRSYFTAVNRGGWFRFQCLQLEGYPLDTVVVTAAACSPCWMVYCNGVTRSPFLSLRALIAFCTSSSESNSTL